jgi:hypothetical protein
MRRVAVLAFLSLTACSPAAPRTETPKVVTPTPPPKVEATRRRFNIVMMSRPSGFSETTIHPDGMHEEVLEIVQNGRGPKVRSKLTFATDGTLATFAATGQNEMGTTVDEKFVIDGGVAKWMGIEENGEAKANGFYLPRAPSMDAMIALVEAIEKHGGKLALLPSGEARLEKTGEATAKGKHLVAYALHGLDLMPQRFWRFDDGTFFGITDAWFAAVPAGYEDAIETLVAVQRSLDRKDDEARARKLAHKPKAGLAITHARVLDVEKKKWLSDHTVVIAGDKIGALGPTATTKVEAGAEVIDAHGAALLPGLWDMHAHLGPSDGALNIASGVTTSRDLGNDPDVVDDYKKRFDEGRAIGPHVLRAGFIEGRGEKAAASKITAETEKEALDAVDFYAKRGFEQIKIYNSMKKELVPILAKAAHEKKMRVSGHVPVFMRAEECIRLGYDEIQHVNMLFLNFFVDEKTDTRTPLRFSLVAEKAADFDFGGKPFKEFLALLVQKKTVIDPTLNAFENLFVDRQGELGPSVLPIASRLPPQVRRHYLSGGLPVPAGKDAHYKASFAAAQKMVKTLFDGGVPVVLGTDSLAGMFLHREMELHALAGIGNGDVLRNATLGSAKVMGRDKTSGSIAVGKDADMFLVDGDPLAKISDVRRVVTTVRGGVVFASADVYAAVSVLPW